MKNIATAFVKAQKEFGPALKTHTNPHFKSRYADLSACIEAVVDALNNNGIAMTQMAHECTNGVCIETIFLHESGEQISSGKLTVPAMKQDPQGYGSAMTYARRYSLMAACGIAPEDDDGNNASKKVDSAHILADLAKSASIEILKSNYSAAMKLLHEREHIAVKQAAQKRRSELELQQKESNE
jgi:hypothetical protein